MRACGSHPRHFIRPASPLGYQANGLDVAAQERTRSPWGMPALRRNLLMSAGTVRARYLRDGVHVSRACWEESALSDDIRVDVCDYAAIVRI